jgi:hypothetical protein
MSLVSAAKNGLCAGLARRGRLERVGQVLASVLLGAICLLGSNLALAKKIYSPTVEPGEFELELRGDTTFDSDPSKDNLQQYKLEAGYGIAQRWFTTLGTTLTKDAGSSDLQTEEVFWENIIQLTEQGEHWVDAGLYLEYAVARGAGTPDEIEGKLLLEKSVGNFVHTANLIFDRNIGNGATNATAFEYAWRSKYFISSKLEVGLEIYGEMGEFGHVLPSNQQDHRIGPVLSGVLNHTDDGKLRYELGYLFGASDAAPNGTLKFNLEYEFRH